MDEPPALPGALELVGYKDVFFDRAADDEAVRVFSVRRRLSVGKALRRVSLAIKDVAEAPIQFHGILNVWYVLGHREGKSCEPGDDFLIPPNDCCLELAPEENERIIFL